MKERQTSWSVHKSFRSSSIADFQLASLRPCLWRTHQPSLAAYSWAHQVQSCNPGVQGAPRLCTAVPWPVHLCRWFFKSLRTLLFLQRLPRSASGSPFHCWQQNIFGCWPSSMELLATGYVSTVSGDLLHSTRVVLFTESYPDIQLISHLKKYLVHSKNSW